MYDLQAARDNEAEGVYTLPRVEEQVPGGRVTHGEVHGQGAQAAVTRQSEGRVLIEHLAVQVHTDVCLHVLWAVVEHLASQQ